MICRASGGIGTNIANSFSQDLLRAFFALVRNILKEYRAVVAHVAQQAAALDIVRVILVQDVQARRVGMQHKRAHRLSHQTIRNGLEHTSGSRHPAHHGRARYVEAKAREPVGLAIQRQAVPVLVDQNAGQ